MSDENQYKDEKTNPLGIGLAATSAQSDSGTRVDLGEDLLEQTCPEIASSAPLEDKKSEKNKEFSEAEEISNVEILINEQIYDEAKKILRKILRKNKNQSKAKELLKQIEEKEIQELLAIDNRASPRLSSLHPEGSQSLDQILQSLESDLRLGIEKEEKENLRSLFPTPEDEESYTRSVLHKVEKLSPKDITDLAIAHIEMGLYSTAVALLEEIVKQEEFATRGMYLLGLALIGNEKYVEATIRLEPMVRDLTLAEDQKTDFLYLMGLAFEHLGEIIKAKDFYRRVYYLNPKYRDISEKIK